MSEQRFPLTYFGAIFLQQKSMHGVKIKSLAASVRLCFLDVLADDPVDLNDQQANGSSLCGIFSPCKNTRDGRNGSKIQ